MWIEEWTFKRHHVIKEMVGSHAQKLLIILDSIVNIGVGGDRPIWVPNFLRKIATATIWNRKSSRTNCVFHILWEVGAKLKLSIFRPGYLNSYFLSQEFNGEAGLVRIRVQGRRDSKSRGKFGRCIGSSGWGTQERTQWVYLRPSIEANKKHILTQFCKHFYTAICLPLMLLA